MPRLWYVLDHGRDPGIHIDRPRNHTLPFHSSLPRSINTLSMLCSQHTHPRCIHKPNHKPSNGISYPCSSLHFQSSLRSRKTALYAVCSTHTAAAGGKPSNAQLQIRGSCAYSQPPQKQPSIRSMYLGAMWRTARVRVEARVNRKTMTGR